MKKSWCLIAAFAFCVSSSAQTHTDLIHVDQFGYLPEAEKVAVIANPAQGFNADQEYTPGSLFQVIEVSSGISVYEGSPTEWNNGATHDQSGDKVYWFDFSALSQEGEFYILDVELQKQSDVFEISPCVYEAPMRHALRAFYYQRCGAPKVMGFAATEWADNTCHTGSLQDTDCRLYNNNDTSTSKDLSGGWHDAGDYNKYVNFAFDPVLNLLEAYAMNPSIWTDDLNIPESGNGLADILDEVKYELTWLLKMQNANGSVLSIVGKNSYESASPPSTDGGYRVYGPSTTSASFSTAAMFAKGAKVFQDAGQTEFAADLMDAAEAAYAWADANPGNFFYNTGNIVSGEQELDSYGTFTRQICAAIYLFELTGDSDYQEFIDANYDESHLIQWWFAYPFEYALQNALIEYAMSPSATSDVASDILAKFEPSMSSNNADNLPAYINQTDAYRAYLSDNNYTWGSNTTKARQGLMFGDMVFYLMDDDNQESYEKAAYAMLQYFHGINPMGLVYLTNMNDYGAERSVNSIYHAWFADGSELWDEVGESTYGPAPGFVPGGANPTYSLDACCPNNCGSTEFNIMCDYGSTTPPLGQPIQKSFRSWNTGWPQNSWTVTEIGIYTQAAYVKLLSQFAQFGCGGVNVDDVSSNEKSRVEVYPNPAFDEVNVVLRGYFGGSAEVRLISISGEMVSSHSINLGKNGKSFQLSLAHIAPGMYIVQCIGQDASIIARLITKS
jgi:endoglucanase